MLKLAWNYMRYYKSQTLAIFASVLLTAALLSGISSLIYSSQKSGLANAEAIYGAWHYSVEISGDTAAGLCGGLEGAGDGYTLENYGILEIKDEALQPFPLQFVYADENYLQMAHRDLLEGVYPQKPDEIAADSYVLSNLGFSGKPGDTVKAAQREYTVTGILKSRWAAGTDEMQIFVSGSFEGKGSVKFLYLAFGEGEKLYKQLDAFQRQYRLDMDTLEVNEGAVRYLGGEKPDSLADIVTFGLTHEEGNLTYIILKLQSEYNLAYYGMLCLLCLFSLFVVYSVFQISAARRASEYGILKALGIREGQIGKTLVLELWMLLFTGYPLGCLLGNGIVSLCCQKLSGVFGPPASLPAGTALTVADQTLAQGSETIKFYTAWNAMVSGFVFLLFSLAAAGFAVVRTLRGPSLKEVMAGDGSYVKAGRRKIYALHTVNMAGIVVRKFMFSNKKKIIGILLSLSVGGSIFLCTTYMVENMKVHAQMSLKSDDGLGSQYRVSLKSTDLWDTIPSGVVEKIRNIPGCTDVYASRYTLGEMLLKRSEFLAREEWSEYFDMQNQEPYFIQRYGGICIEKEDGSYGIKYNVYGYDQDLIRQLSDFLLEGEIPGDIRQMEEQDQIIAAANMDGQGNYYFYGKKPGDTITLRVPVKEGCTPQRLKFQSREEEYITKEFTIAAIVTRPIAQEQDFLNTGVWKNQQCVIMSNGQMERNFGITGYSFLNASPAAGAEPEEVSSRLLTAISDVPKAVLQDYAGAVKTQKDYLRQQQIFFSVIAFILLVISLFHIINSMNHTILARKREYGILRAMGITDAGFYKMMLQTGILYGLLTDIFVFFIYNGIFRRVMNYYMAHVLLFLHVQSEVPDRVLLGIMVLNVVIACAAVMIPARRLIRENIIREISW